MHDNSGLLLTGGRIYTGDLKQPWAEAIVTRGDRIAFLGSEAEARQLAKGAEEIRLPGSLVVPGLNYSHVHMTMAAYNLPRCDVQGIFTMEKLQGRLRDYAQANPELRWIEAWGCAYEPFMDSVGREREALDRGIADRPVYVRAFDSHSSWCNTHALRLAGIEHGSDIPLPNEVVVDRATGLATGMLKESLAHALVVRAIGEPTAEERDQLLLGAIRYCNELGITSVQNMDADLNRLEQYDRLLQRRELTVRAAHWLTVREEMPRDYVVECAQMMRRFNGPWNHVPGIKMFIDGVVESKTAMMFEPYSDGSGDVGVPDMDPDAYREIAVMADGLDMDVATHAIGDRGVHTAIDTYEATGLNNPSRLRRRHRIEHIETIQPQDIPRIGALGITASMQPLHAAPTTDPRYTPYTKMIGRQREPYAFNWRSIVEGGARLSFGSDWPIVTCDVRPGIHTALTRQTVEGEPSCGWNPHQCVTLGQAVDAYTTGAAYAESQETIKGALCPGMLADITVFAEDLYCLAPHEMLGVPIALTVVDGRVVHRAK